MIHIGLPKTGSTALQNYWESHKKINCHWNSLTEMVNITRNKLHSNADYDELPEFRDFLPDTPAQEPLVNIFTSEALSTFSWGYALSGEDITKARWFFADIMSNKVSESSVLIIVRDPIDWIKSIHKQYIQEGGVLTLQNFFNNEREFLAATLNIQELHEIWSEYYPAKNIIVLPYEMLRDNIFDFNLALSSKLQIPPDLNLISELPYANKSISSSEAEFMRHTSRWLYQIEKTAVRSKLTLKNIRNDLMLAIRTELQSKDKLSQFINRAIPSNEPRLTIDESFFTSLESSFLEFLKMSYGDLFGHLPIYKQNIEKTRKRT